MMDMGIGSIVGGAFGFLGAMEQADAQREATQANWAINVWNMQMRERERAEAIAMALKQRKEQQLGTTDIHGTRTKFIPGQGWVTTAAPNIKQMQEAQNAEQMRVLNIDLPMRRKVMERNYARGLQDEGTADSLRRMFVNASGAAKSDEGYASDLYQAQAMGLREASGDAGRRAWTQAMRTNQNSNFDELAASLQRTTNDSYAKAAMQAKLMSRGAGEKERATEMGQLANLYNMFASRAGQLPEVAYRPQDTSSQGTLTASMQGDLTAGTLAANMMAKKGGELDYVQPNFGYGNAIAGAGAALGSAFNKMGAQSAYNDKQNGVQGFGATGGGWDMASMFNQNETNTG